MAFEEAWLCSAVGVGKSFVFESHGFKRLFGCREERLGSPMIGSSDRPLLSQVEAMGMSPEQLENKLGFLETYAALEQRDVIRACPLAKAGCSLQLAQKQTGEVFVSQVTMSAFEGTNGVVYTVSIHDDATNMCSVKHLLDIAGTGEYFVLLRALRIQLRCQEACQRVRRLEAFLQDLLSEDLTEGVSGGSFGPLTQISLPCCRRPASQSTSSGRNCSP